MRYTPGLPTNFFHEDQQRSNRDLFELRRAQGIDQTMGRICITIPNSTIDIITKEAPSPSGKSEWICAAIDHYLRTRNRGPDQLSDPERRALADQIKDLEIRLSEKHQDLEWTRGQLIETQRNLTAALEKIPQPPAMLTDGQHKPSWWDRLMGRG